MSTGEGATRSPDPAERVADAYVWGLPLLLTHRTRTAHESGAGRGLVVRDRLSSAADRGVVAPNNDTLYASGWFDLTAGDVVVDARVASPPDRYWSVMLLDAYTHVAYVCRRIHGRAGARVRVTYDPSTPPVTDRGAGLLTMGTPTLWVLVRVLVDGPGDLDAARASLACIRVTQDAPVPGSPGPLVPAGAAPTAVSVAAARPFAAERPVPATGARPAGPRPPGPPAGPREGVGPAGGGVPPAGTGPAVPGPRGLDTRGAGVLTELGPALAGDPPAAWHPAPPGGLDALHRLVDDPPPPDVVVEGARRGEERIRAHGAGADRFGNGWGTRSRGAAFGDDVTYRAAFGRFSLAGHLPAENRGYNRVVDGTRCWLLRFPPGGAPPVDGFWSLTVYGPDLFLVPNELDRHSVGDRTPGLRRAADGSLAIALAPTRPGGATGAGEADGATWLPTPDGPCVLVLRCYEGREGVRDATWFPPGLEPLP